MCLPLGHMTKNKIIFKLIKQNCMNKTRLGNTLCTEKPFKLYTAGRQMTLYEIQLVQAND